MATSKRPPDDRIGTTVVITAGSFVELLKNSRIRAGLVLRPGSVGPAHTEVDFLSEDGNIRVTLRGDGTYAVSVRV